MSGSKSIVRSIINQLKIKQRTDPAYMLYLLEKLFLVLEDVYSVSSATELQEAIDEIGEQGGTIFIESGTHIVNTTIDIDGGGTYVIYGHGDNTILEPAAGIRLFNVSDSVSVLFRTFKVDTSNYILPTTEAFFVNETNNNLIAFEDITIAGNGVSGVGIEFQSDNGIVNNCNITLMNKGIYVNNSNNHSISMNVINSHSNKGIDIDTSNNLLISSNNCNSNTLYGIYADTVTYSTFSNNICGSNVIAGIYIISSTNSTFSSNICNSNSLYGMYITGSSYNTFSGNTCNLNVANNILNSGGIYITSNSDYNTISSNSANNNTNAGAGTGYGIIIAAATCNENVIYANNANLNDIDFQDTGTATSLTYYVQNLDELQDAIDSIGSKAGIIHIDESLTISSTIDIDGGGSYLIEGNGSNTVLTPSSDITCINIDNARQVILKNFKIDASALTTSTKEIIDVNENSDNLVVLDNITIVGDGTNGYGIELNSNNVSIENCVINTINRGINVLSDNNFMRSNIITNCTNGIYLSSVNYNNITSNTCNSNTNGIYLSSSDSNVLIGNTIRLNTTDGISINSSDYNIILGNNVIGNLTNGLHLSISSYNHLSDNISKDNDSNSASITAGLYIEGDSNENVIIGNSLLDNNNSGASDAYGVYIKDSTGDRNIIQGNTISGNDINWKDSGTNTQIEYLCSSGTEIQNAIDSIAAKSGIIKLIVGNIALSSAIDIDGGGDYIIEGNGIGSVIDCNSDITTFNITSVNSLIIRNLKIDATDLTTATKEIINVNEALDNLIFIDNITIVGDGTNGYGIELNSNNVSIENCVINTINRGINVLSNDNFIRGNTITSCDIGIYLTNSDKNNIQINKLNNNTNEGIILSSSDNNNIGNNICNSNTKGIKVLSSTDNNVSGNTCYSNSNYGIEINASDDNVVSLNKCNSNTLVGIYITGSDDNSFNGNGCNNNNTNSATSGGGIQIVGDSNNNLITGCICTGNINAGAGTGYGIYIQNSTGDDNVVESNTFNGNDVQILDNGTNTQIIYKIAESSDFQDAIDSIGSGHGKILILNDLTDVQVTINNSSAEIIIEGITPSTTLDSNGDNTIIYVTDCENIVIRDLKFDASAVTTQAKPIIYMGGTPTKGLLENLIILGNISTPRGYGILVSAEYVDIKTCYIAQCYYGIYIETHHVSVLDCYIRGNAENEIHIYGGSYLRIQNSYIYQIYGKSAIYNESGNTGVITGNLIHGASVSSASSWGAIHFSTNGDAFLIQDNLIFAFLNTGAGISYGIYLASGCDNNLVGINHIYYCDEKVYDAGSNNENIRYPGMIAIHPTSTPPTGWLLCDGSAVSRTTYAALFAAIGITHGQGDGSTTFNLPDYEGRFLRGTDNGAGRDPDAASRTAMATGGNTGDNVGSVQADAMDDHTHDNDSAYSHPYASYASGGGRCSNLAIITTWLTGTVTSGTSNLSTENRPINANVNFIIRY